MKPRLFLWLVAAVLIAGLVASPMFAQAPATKGQATKAAKQEAKQTPEAKKEPATKKAVVEAQTPPQPGMVWVNTASKVYHKEGDRYYGKTKNGKWMTEAEAQKAGYKEAGAGAAKAAAKKPAAKKTP